MLSVNMPSAHTHRFLWRRCKPFVAAMLLVGIAFSVVAPFGAGIAYAVHEEGHVEGPSAPAISTADVSSCTQTDPMSRARCIFFQIIAEVLLFIASLLGRILVFLVDILIAFASYNDFGSTTVVARGWVIVRDLVNMFFIVILLVSAFATIIGYDEGSFHYKRVLPKLLLMAVLINFSRTLILLLVDFSQVVMLTFVNAFRQAGPGNLVAALKLDSVLKMAPPTAGAGTDAVATAQAQSGIQGTVDHANLILAIMLAIFMLSISLGIVIIMVGYLIFRIVGLWIALILSPIALFATALPGRLQKGMDNFTGKYWTRLSALLVGGPVMAFFLWLTFAVTQNSVGAGGLAPALNFKVTNPTVTFLTTIGNSQDIASFIVGITLMLMGLDAAVSSASAVSETLGKFATKTASASKALGKLAATAPYLGAYYAGRAGARYVDRRADITGKAATAAAATVGQIPILRTALRKPLTAAMTKRRREDLAEAKELQEGLEYMTPAQRSVMLASTKGLIPTGGEKMAAAQQWMERAAPKNAQAIKDSIIQTHRNQATAEKEKELRAKGLSGAALQGALGEAQREIENRAQQYADRDVASRQAYFMNKAKEQATAAGDMDMVRKIDDELKKNPNLALNKQEIAKELLADKDALNGMSATAKGDVGVLAAILSEAKAVKTDPDGNAVGFDHVKLDALKDKIKDKGLLENIEMTEKFINQENAVGKPVSRAQLEGMLIGKNENGKARMFQMPVKQAGKDEGVAAEIERAVSALPGGRVVTGREYGPASTLADFGRASYTPVKTELARQTEAAFKKDPANVANIEKMIDIVSAEAAFERPEAWNAYKGDAGKELDTVKDFTMLRTEKDHPTQKGKKVIEYVPSKSKAEVDAGLKKFEQMAKKMDDMSETQLDEFLATAAEKGIPDILVNVRRAGYADKGKNEATDKYIKKLVRIEKMGKATGKLTENQTKAIAALDKLRSAIEKSENKGFGNAWRKTLEPEE